MRHAVIFMIAAALGACDDMSVQPKQKVYSPLVGPAKTPLDVVEFLETPTPPPNVTLALLERGRNAIVSIASPVIPSWETGAAWLCNADSRRRPPITAIVCCGRRFSTSTTS